MKRVFTSLVVLLVVFAILAVVIGQLPIESVKLPIPFFPTIQTSVKAVAYASFFIGLLLATVIALAGDLALRKRFRQMMLEQRKQLNTNGGTKDIADTTVTTPPSEHKSPE
ncbi:hypothetical protein [Candidatus Cryosericum terrychapinii]|jgi:tetrahydromethanopterin S-methyltransferase subunit C|uniref:LapA family protein n=1 Tax=Candidatus Cryosericum terrychapinii TaxID=2290919 RepID=A0A398D648_9BACT|nr:hypothetical protein [Candidatus Cryosericum terrychapinii]RIE06971.1 hypothetical protein SMC7_00355 [Candidatus Cryosericum terrychapinii]